jgi:KDO2-lipid IV(A) lauroyltransferase
VPAGRPDTRRERLVGLAWSAAWELTRWIPEGLAFRLADLGGRYALHRGGDTLERVRANLAHVVPPEELDATVDAAYRSYARYWIEAFRAADMPADEVLRRTTSDGFEMLDEVLDEGNGAIVLLAHHGSWDMGGRWSEIVGYHLVVVAQVVRPLRVFRRFVRLREAIGMEVVPLVPRSGLSGKGIATRLGEALRENSMVGLLSDRDLSGTAPMVEFFGTPCQLPVGATVLAKRTRTPIVPIALMQRPGRRWHMKTLKPLRVHELEIHEAQRQVARALEEIIRLDPTQWHAFQRIWPAESET